MIWKIRMYRGKSELGMSSQEKKMIKGDIISTLSMSQSWMINPQRKIRGQRRQAERENATLI